MINQFLLQLFIVLLVLYIGFGIRYSARKSAVVIFIDKAIYYRQGFFWFPPLLFRYVLFETQPQSEMFDNVKAITSDYTDIKLGVSISYKITQFDKYFYLSDPKNHIKNRVLEAILTVSGKENVDFIIKNREKFSSKVINYLNSMKDPVIEFLDMNIFEFERKENKKETTPKKVSSSKKSTKKSKSKAKEVDLGTQIKNKLEEKEDKKPSEKPTKSKSKSSNSDDDFIFS